MQLFTDAKYVALKSSYGTRYNLNIFLSLTPKLFPKIFQKANCNLIITNLAGFFEIQLCLGLLPELNWLFYSPNRKLKLAQWALVYNF